MSKSKHFKLQFLIISKIIPVLDMVSKLRLGNSIIGLGLEIETHCLKLKIGYDDPFYDLTKITAIRGF